MRDPKRIDEILALLEKVWKENPDLRLTQLIGNCFSAGDLYYVEDDKLKENIEFYYGDNK